MVDYTNQSPLSISGDKMSKFRLLKNEKYFHKICAKWEVAHLQYMNTHYAKFE